MEIRHNPFWNILLETLPREKLIEIELKNFRQLLKYAKDNSALYRMKLHDINPLWYSNCPGLTLDWQKQKTSFDMHIYLIDLCYPLKKHTIQMYTQSLILNSIYYPTTDPFRVQSNVYMLWKVFQEKSGKINLNATLFQWKTPVSRNRCEVRFKVADLFNSHSKNAQKFFTPKLT